MLKKDFSTMSSEFYVLGLVLVSFFSLLWTLTSLSFYLFPSFDLLHLFSRSSPHSLPFSSFCPLFPHSYDTLIYCLFKYCELFHRCYGCRCFEPSEFGQFRNTNNPIFSAESQKIASSISGGVNGISHWLNLPAALWSTQPLK